MHSTSPLGWDAPALAAVLKALKDRGYTATRIATLAQVSRPQVSRWSSGGHRPGYDPLRTLAAALLEEHPTEEYRAIVTDLCTAAGYPGIAADLGASPSPAKEEAPDPYVERARRIVRRLERRAEDAGLTEDERQRMIQRALDNAEEQGIGRAHV